MRHELRSDLPPIPSRIAALPVSPKGYPTPWFVETMPDGTRDFRIMSAGRRVLAVRKKLCWVCGEPVGRHMTFVAGPMCGINRTTAEPPCHMGCAVWSAMACPFMVLPAAKYRLANLPEDARTNEGALTGNPGVAMLWTCQDYTTFRTPGGDWLITMGEPDHVHWFCEGRRATRDEVVASIDARIHFLEDVAREHGELDALACKVDDFKRFLP